MIRAIIIEDEQNSNDFLVTMLNSHFKYITIEGVCKTIEEGKEALIKLQPDLVFSDIELGTASAFTLFQQLEKINFEVIFISGQEKYALQAIKFSALDYLLKPFSLSDLNEALNRYHKKKDKKQSEQQFEALFHNLKNLQKDSKKIALPTLTGLLIIPVKDIIRCQADVNYTTLHLIAKDKIVACKSLKEFDELLNDYDFLRIHNSHLINLNFVKNYTKGDGGVVTMIDGTEVDVSRRKRDEFLKRLAEL
jgi:two-component system LytT family response regulator